MLYRHSKIEIGDIMTQKEKKQSYGEQSIVSLKGAERVRNRPAVIFGSDGLDGCKHSFFEILSNSVDEAREGYGNEIITTVYLDRSIKIEDHGRGIPLGYNEAENRYNWELIYCELYASGKYANNQDGSAYTYSLGTNGLGACATQYSSEYFEVTSYDGKNASTMHFEKGEPIGSLEVRPIEKKEIKHGTVQKWRPDLEVFTDTLIPEEYFKEVLKTQSASNGGTMFVLNIEREGGKFDKYEYYYENGIEDYLTEIVGENETLTSPVKWFLETSGRDREDMEDYKLKGEFIWCVSSKVNALRYFHNSSYLEHGGSPDEALKAAFVYAVDKKLKATGKYSKNKNETKIKFADIEDCLIFISNSFSTVTSYENQTKKSITNSFIAKAMTAFFKEQLEFFFLENPADAERFLNQVMINKRSREKAETTRIDVKKALASSNDIAGKVEKFVACRSKDVSRRELYIVEGDSAMGSCKLGRNAEFQAIIPVRGKTLNCLKSSYEKIFKNDIIIDLLRVIGCGVEISEKKVKGNMSPFDLSALRWSKIIICTDADEDGFQIRTLLLTLFYRLLPTLIDEGKVYIAETPLYEITCKDNIYFAYDENEKAEILEKIGNKKYTIQRSKGLGENEPEMMWQTTMNPETRRLIRVSKADAVATEEIFNTLLGENLAARKEYIFTYGSNYADEADI